MTNITQTSLESWDRLQKSLGARQAQVLRALKKLGSANNREIALYLNIPINSCVPRIFELRKEGLVIQHQIVIDSCTKRKTISWRIK